MVDEGQGSDRSNGNDFIRRDARKGIYYAGIYLHVLLLRHHVKPGAFTQLNIPWVLSLKILLYFGVIVIICSNIVCIFTAYCNAFCLPRPKLPPATSIYDMYETP